MKSFKQVINERYEGKIEKDDVFVTKGKVYPSYVVHKVDGDFVEYTIHQAHGSKQTRLVVNMFRRIKDLEYEGKQKK